MATLTIENLPEALYEEIQRAARANRRTISAEVIMILERALVRRPVDEMELAERARELRGRSPAYVTSGELHEAIDEGRA